MSVVADERPAPTPEKVTFARRLKAARELAGLTQEELAARLGMSVWAIRHWEKADYLPRAQVYVARVNDFMAGVESGTIPANPKAGQERPWSRHWAACRACGKTEKKHNGRGYCTGCSPVATREIAAERAATGEAPAPKQRRRGRLPRRVGAKARA